MTYRCPHHDPLIEIAKELAGYAADAEDRVEQISEEHRHCWRAEEKLRRLEEEPKQDFGTPAIARRILAFINGDQSDAVLPNKAVFDLSSDYRVTVEKR